MVGYSVKQTSQRTPVAGPLTTGLLGLLVLFAVAGGVAQAQLSPGDLHQSHAFLEGVENCEQCHGSDRETLGENCLICHLPIAQQHDSGRGLHGRGEYDDCELCHVEHQGRDFDLIYFKNGRRSFDHGLTGYTLEGKHTTVDCRQCHQVKNIGEPNRLKNRSVNLDRTFLGLDQSCLGCHFDEHRSQLSSTCTRCHDMEGWRPASGFNHVATKYPLTGRHAAVACEKCHLTIKDTAVSTDAQFRKYTGVAGGSCTDCHQDAHAGRLGDDCSRCHTTDGWRQVTSAEFDHSRTRYPLEGRHASVNCKKCHDDRSAGRKIEFAACRDCHRDFHNGVFADRAEGACEQCHTVAGFTPSLFTIDAHNRGAYPLVGAHLAIPCFECHLDPDGSARKYLFKFATTACDQCHRDPHRGEVDKYMTDAGCESCHTVAAWSTISFDHAKTAFPLDGRHTAIACKSCHTEAASDHTKFTNLPKACAACHTDIHRGQFALEIEPDMDQTDCTRCHTSKTWRATQFDHSRDARFVLDGAHKSVPCRDCHPTVGEPENQLVRYRPLASRCVDCHQAKTVEGESKS